MKIRSDFIPKSISDFGAFVFLVTIIPITYWFEIFVVIPSLYEYCSVWHILHTMCGTILMINITSNFVAAVLVDTSIKGRMLNDATEDWHFCTVCETMVPPRAWHCTDCDACILKREHHCLFTACCIGHYNYRFFFMFVLYLAVATIYATYFNLHFLWDTFEPFSLYTILKIALPMVVFFFDSTSNQFYLMLFVVNISGIVFTGTLLSYHLILIKNGQVTYENVNNITKYNLGWKQNVIEILGERWYLAWIFPSITSKLPHDGITWHTTDQWQLDGHKYK